MHDVSQGDLGQVRARRSLKCYVIICEDVGSSRGRFSNIGSKKAVAVGRGFFSQPG